MWLVLMSRHLFFSLFAKQLKDFKWHWVSFLCRSKHSFHQTLHTKDIHLSHFYESRNRKKQLATIIHISWGEDPRILQPPHASGASEKSFGWRPCSWIHWHSLFLNLYKHDVCVIQPRCCVCVGEQMCCCALQMLHLLCGGTRWLASPGPALWHCNAHIFSPHCRTHSGTGSTCWGGFPKHPLLFNFGLGLGWNGILMDHIIHIYVIPVQRSRLWWNVIAFKVQAVRKCLDIHIASFESLSSLKF